MPLKMCYQSFIFSNKMSQNRTESSRNVINWTILRFTFLHLRSVVVVIMYIHLKNIKCLLCLLQLPIIRRIIIVAFAGFLRHRLCIKMIYIFQTIFLMHSILRGLWKCKICDFFRYWANLQKKNNNRVYAVYNAR